MARRTVKPFTVEVRNSGGRSEPALGITPEPAEPAVEREPAPPTATVPTSRVLPATDEPEAAAMPKKPKRRRALVASAIVEPPWLAEDDAEQPIKLEPDEVEDADTPIKANPVPRKPSRLPRNTFKREERWRSRLPAVVHRTRRWKT